MRIGITFKNNKYDESFKKYVGMYNPTLDWRLLKAQCNTESNLNPLAESPGVGAQGLCQFMPETWAEYQSDLHTVGSPFDPKTNIMFAAYYMHVLRDQWTAKRPEFDHHSLAMASFNAGTGHIERAQRKCGNKSLWFEISPCLVQITGVANAKQTTDYVIRNWLTYEDIVLTQKK
jgi:membrane-bound lytic murein transglycosylase F